MRWIQIFQQLTQKITAILLPNKKTFTFEDVFVSTERTSVVAKDREEAEKMVLSGDCKWTVIKADGNEIILIGEKHD